MNPVLWALRPFRHYADFSGRSPRAEYWWYVLAVSVVGFILGLIDGALLGGPIFGNYGPLGLTFTLAIIVPGVALTARRLHDIDRSAWWCLLKVSGYTLSFWFAAGAKEQIQAMPEFGPATSNVLVSLFFIALLVFVCVGITYFVFLVTPGTEGENGYGPDPYGPDHLEQVFA